MGSLKARVERLVRERPPEYEEIVVVHQGDPRWGEPPRPGETVVTIGGRQSADRHPYGAGVPGEDS